MILYSTGTVFFFMALSSLEDQAKTSESLKFSERERERERERDRESTL